MDDSPHSVSVAGIVSVLNTPPSEESIPEPPEPTADHAHLASVGCRGGGEWILYYGDHAVRFSGTWGINQPPSIETVREAFEQVIREHDEADIKRRERDDLLSSLSWQHATELGQKYLTPMER